MTSDDEPKRSNFYGSKSDFAVTFRMCTERAVSFPERKVTVTHITVVLFSKRSRTGIKA